MPTDRLEAYPTLSERLNSRGLQKRTSNLSYSEAANRTKIQRPRPAAREQGEIPQNDSQPTRDSQHPPENHSASPDRRGRRRARRTRCAPVVPRSVRAHIS